MSPRLVYVCGPMSGYPAFNYPAFNDAAAELRKAGYAALNPVDSERHNISGKPQSWDWYMRHALRMVTDADGIALLPGWEASKGATVEVYVARALGMPIRSLAAWLREDAERMSA